uniref:Atg6 BARA domain-containing protein n=1 Tax=Spumella elongata TaxID=89044 RepID=A0A7S3H0Z9_9STRA|mmetsp:Transcript_29809/g.51118  ORF Transcript_29809/g.51118 Transcript_29809/m.51118 type:complete len:308 (+) Transcript_29809:16-939(+)
MQSNVYLLQRESDFITSSETSFESYLEFLKSSEDNVHKTTSAQKIEKDLQAVDAEVAALNERLRAAKAAKAELQLQRSQFALQVHNSRVLQEQLNSKVNDLQNEHNEYLDQIVSMDDNMKIAVASYDRFKQINTLNDAFYVWYTGPFATINAFKLGNLVNKPVESTEINAALGQAALVLNIITSRCGIEFKQFHIVPMGSFAKILKADDRRTSYPLFIDAGSFSFFPKRNFNLALSGFMQCIHELGEYISAYDPTLSVPYKIEVSESKIADKSFVYGGDEEVWTHALKHMLANIKWIIAWYCKHGNY